MTGVGVQVDAASPTFCKRTGSWQTNASGATLVGGAYFVTGAAMVRVVVGIDASRTAQKHALNGTGAFAAFANLSVRAGFSTGPAL